MTTTGEKSSRPEVIIRMAQPADRPAGVSALARAFWNDPFLVHFYPDEGLRDLRIGGFFDLLWRLSMPMGHVEVTQNCEAVALWRPPGQWRTRGRTIAANLPSMLLTYGGAIRRVMRCLGTMETHHPNGPHWYLATVGTDPLHQGRGYAGRLIRSRLRRCDVRGEAVYLEAATEGHVPFYSGLGFRLMGELKVPGGPSFFPMWRDPQ